MATRNTRVLSRIIKALGTTRQKHALARPERHFDNELLLVVANTTKVAEYAEELRLRITPTEWQKVLDYIARKRMADINIETIETAINTLFKDRFIEP